MIKVCVIEMPTPKVGEELAKWMNIRVRDILHLSTAAVPYSQRLSGGVVMLGSLSIVTIVYEEDTGLEG